MREGYAFHKRDRACRRAQDARKEARLYEIVTRKYIPHAGYVEMERVCGRLVPVGDYIRYPKNSVDQRILKRMSSRRARKYMGLSAKGNGYRRVFDYWWNLY